MSIKPIKKAVFPVAGMGTRCLPATKVMPKEMLTVADKPLIQHVVEEALEAGIEELIFVTSPHKKLLEQHFEPHAALEEALEAKGKNALLAKVRAASLPDGAVKTAYQDEPLGLGHAIWCAKDLIGNEPFAVLLPDVLALCPKGKSCTKQIVDIYNQTGGNVIAVEDVPEDQVDKYGIVDPGEESNGAIAVKGLVEKPDPADAPSTMSVIGRYILQPEVFDHLSKHEKGAGGEIQLTDALDKLIATQPFHAARFEGKTLDSGNSLGFISANISYALAHDEIGDDVAQLILQTAESLKGNKNVAAAE